MSTLEIISMIPLAALLAACAIAFAWKPMKWKFTRIIAWLWRSLMPDWIVQRRLLGTLYAMSIRDHALWLIYGDKAAGAEKVPFPAHGHVWDLGCNIGLFSVAAAQSGCRVTAFDISETNVLCVRQTAWLNHFNICAVNCPVTTSPCQWERTENGHTENAMTRKGKLVSLTYEQAAQIYGMPDFIKFDIQGGEREFLMGTFKDWVMQHGIAIYLETHGDCASWVWPEMTRIGPIHYWLPSTKSP